MKTKLTLLTAIFSFLLSMGSIAKADFIIEELSASTRSNLNLPLKDKLTLATKADMVFVEKLTPDMKKAVEQFLNPISEKIVISAARQVGDHLLLWISFPEVIDGGIDLIWSLENRKGVGTFLGGYRG